MIWLILAALGVLLWLVLGGLRGVVLSRRRFKRLPGSFACKAREVPADSGPRARQQARWVSKVLLIHCGVAFAPFEALEVDHVSSDSGALQVKGLGDHPVMALVTLVDGSTWHVATASPDALSMNHLPADDARSPT